MRKHFKSLLPVFLFVGVLIAGVWDSKVITFNTGDVTSSAFLTTGGDTTDIFDLTKGGKGKVYPKEVSFLMKVVEGTNSPGADVTFTLFLSQDQSVWYNAGALKNVTDSGTNAETITDSKTLLMASMANSSAASIAITEAFVMTYDSTLNEAINAQPWVAAGDSSAFVTSVANTRAETYTYNFGFMPQYRYGQVRVIGALQAGDTVTVGLNMTRAFD